jgi:phytanoyl-CoA hydroxylase
MSSISCNDETIENHKHLFSDAELAEFHTQGFVIVRGLGDSQLTARMRQVSQEHLEREIAPLELESEVKYPGAPTSQAEPGGRTIRRLKQTHARDIVFTEWVCSPPIVARLSQLLGPKLVMPLAHHNCVMTKQPHHSSDTRWHQDIRYWSFPSSDLISVWLALGNEYPQNGGLLVVPGSHRMSFEPAQFDETLFFRDSMESNRQIIETAVPVEMKREDVLFFHCRTLHSASRNFETQTKFSAVFTFRAADNSPPVGSRSALAGELILPAAPTSQN